MPDSIRGKNVFNAVADTVIDVSKSPISIGGVVISNLAIATGWLQMFDALAADVVLGTTKPAIAISCPATSSVEEALWDVKFDTALSIAVTTSPINAVAGSANITLASS